MITTTRTTSESSHRRALLCLTILLLSVQALPVYGAEARGDTTAEFRLATFSADLTPPLGQPIYSSYEPLATVEHPLLAKGIVLEAGPSRYIICAVDWCELCNSTHQMFRRKLAQAARTDPDNVAVQTIHQHTAPMGDGDASNLLAKIDNPPPYPTAEFFAEAADRLAAAVEQSLDRLQPFDRVGTGQAKVQQVASSRRVPGPDGKILIRWSACKDPALRVEPEGKIDPMVKTITFARGDKPLVRLHYYAVHPQSFYGDPRASYDFPGIARERLQQKEGVFQIYFTGCAGDVTAGKYNDGSPEERQQLADRLLAGMEAAAGATRFVPADRLLWRTVRVPIQLRTDAGYREADSRRIMADTGARSSRRIYGGAMRLAFAARSQTPLELSALEIAGMHILHLPGECMVDYQLYAQDIKPDAFVAVAAYGDCGCGYVCTEKAFSEGGYEPRDSLLAPSFEQPLKTAIRRLLGVE